MKNTLIMAMLAFMLFGCSRNENDPNNNASTGIESISGLYKGGTLVWYTLNNTNSAYTNGTDPNATIDIKYLGNDKISITVITSAPVPLKSAIATLKTKQESNPIADSYMGYFTFEMGNELIASNEQNGTYSSSEFNIITSPSLNQRSCIVSIYNKSNTTLTSFFVNGNRN